MYRETIEVSAQLVTKMPKQGSKGKAFHAYRLFERSHIVEKSFSEMEKKTRQLNSRTAELERTADAQEIEFGLKEPDTSWFKKKRKA